MVAEEAARLLLAAKNGDLSSLNSENLNESVQDEHGATCLHYAARGGHVPVLQHLINTRGFHPTKRSNVGATALHDAAATGQLEALKWLLEHNDVKVDDQDGTGATVTHLAARYGHTQTLEWLLDNTNCDVLKKSASGALPLHFAAEGGHVECVKLLVAEAPRSVNMQMNSGCTPVYLACQSGHLMAAEYLASKNGTPKIHTFDGMSPLHASAQTGQLHIVKWLIKEQGLNANERDFDGATPLHYAASRGHTYVVDWLLKEGGARIILDNLGGSPLHTAAEFGNNKIVQTLLSNGCDKDITDNEGLTAEELAEKCGNEHTAAILRGEALPQEELETAVFIRAAAKQTLPPQPEQQKIFTPIPSTPSQPAPQPSLPPLKSSKRPAPQPPRKAQASQETDSGDTLENLPGGRSAAVIHRPPSIVSVASSASSFGYFSPQSKDKTEVVVDVDVHDSPSKVCITSSQETGEREIKPCRSAQSKVTPHDLSRASASAAHYLSAAASSSGQLPALRHGFLPANQPSPAVHSSQVHSNGHGQASSREGREGERRGPETAPKPGREESPSVAQRKALLQSAAGQGAATRIIVSRAPTMEGAKVNGSVPNGSTSNGSVSSTSSGASGGGGAAKSVIKISNKNVTIISTGKDGGSSAPKFTTTPLRSNNDETLSGAHVSNRKKDADFISSLAQKYQGNGAASSSNSVRPTPVASSSAYRGQTNSGEKVSALATKPAWQQQQKAAAAAVASSVAAAGSSASATVGQRRQQAAESVRAGPVPPVMVNGHTEESSHAQTNGHNGDTSPGAAPPAPPPAPPLLSPSEQPAVRKADASYTPRAKTYSTQSSHNGSIPGTPRGPGTEIHQNKNDLMAALTAVVTSGSPSASLRKTRGPGKGAFNEVYSKKASGATTPNGTPAPALLPIEEFDPKNFLDKVGDTDHSGNKIPDWKRHMLAKNMAAKALEEHLKKKKEEEYEARFKNMPAWKRALIEKKEGAGGK